jgi:lysozyme
VTSVEIASGLVKHFEGLYLKPYLCPAGIPTIGYGSTRYEDGKKVTLRDTSITKDIAEKLLYIEIHKCISKSVKYCPVLIKYPERLGAIADFVYNLGAGRLQTSTLRRRINQQDWLEVKKELMRWVRGGGRILPGLVLRRQAEARLI